MTVPSSNQDELFNVGLIRSYVDKELNPRFVERHWLKQQIEEKLANPNCRFVLLTAEPGAGKSAFMAWLAYLNPQWSRYFIRRDQRTPLGDVGAHSLLLQIGFQLAAIYPDLFNQEQIEITVRQRIGQASDSEIVGAEIQRIIASPFRRKVVDIQQEVRESRKTQATGIRIGEIYSDVRLVPIDDLQGMALIDPAIALARTNPDQQIVILVDALDELSYRDINGTLIQWLATCPELPPNIRFILTARPNTPELEHFCETKRDQIQKLAIQEKDLRVIADSLNYVKQWVDRTPRIQTALQTKGHEIELFAQKAAEKADGNLGYLETIARAVDQADDEQINQFLDLSSLPGELEDLYGFFFRKIKDTVGQNTIRVEGDQPNQVYHYEAWLEVYRPILGVLAVAREPVTLQQIQQLGQIPCDWTYLVNAIGKLRQFLDQVDNSRYCLYHSTLPEFLTSEKAKVAYDYCYIDSVKQNQRVIQCYRGTAESWQEVNLEQIDDYGLRHLTLHLVQANLQQELHELLDLDKGGLNAWFEVKDSNGDVAGFLADVALAWSQAEKEFASSHQAELLGLQYRYALLTASVNNLSTNIPVALLIALVKTEEWKPERALAYAKQILERYQKSEALRELAPYLPEPLRSQAYKEALACWSIPSRPNSWAKFIILTDMVQYAPNTLLKLLPSIQLIDNPKISIWRKLGECLPSNLIEEAIHFLDTSKADKEQWTEILIALAPSLPAKMLDALDALSEISDPSLQADALAHLIPHLPNTLISKVTHYQHLNGDPKVLSAWLIRLPELITVLRHRYVNISDLLNISNLSSPALEVLTKLSEQDTHIYYPQLCEILNTIIPHISETAFSEIVETIKTLNNEDKERILLDLIPQLSGDLLLEASKVFLGICDGYPLTAVLPFLPKCLLIDAFKAIDRSSSHQETLLTLLVWRLPKSEYLTAIHIAVSFSDKKISRSALTTLAKYLPDHLLPIAYQASKGIFYEAIQLPLSSHESEQIIQNALSEVQSITDEKEQMKALIDLIPFLPSYFISQLLEIGTEIQDKQSLKAAGSFFIQGQIEEAGERFMEALARRFHNKGGEWIAELVEISPRLPKDHDLWLNILNLLERGLNTQNWAAWALAYIAPHVPNSLRPKIVELAKLLLPRFTSSPNDFYFLIYCFSEIIPDAIRIAEVTEMYSDDAVRSYELSELLPFLPASYLPVIFSLSQIYSDKHGFPRPKKIFDFHIYRAIVPEKFDSVWKAKDRWAREDAIKGFIGSGYWFERTGLSPIEILQKTLANNNEDFFKVSLIELLQASQAILDESEQVQALKALTRYSLEAVPFAFKKAVAIPSVKKRKEILEELVLQIPEELISTTLDLLQTIRSDEHRSLALVTLSVHLPVNTISKALEVAQSIQDDRYQLDALYSIFNYLPSELLPEAFRAILRIKGNSSQVSALLAGMLLYLRATRWVLQGKNGYRTTTLLQVLPDLTELMSQILAETPELVMKIRDELRQNPNFLQELQELPTELRELLQKPFITNAILIILLLPLLPLLNIILKNFISSNDDSNNKADETSKELVAQYQEISPFLKSLVSVFPEPLLRKSLEAVGTESKNMTLQIAASLKLLPDYLEPDLYEVYFAELQSISKTNLVYSWEYDKFYNLVSVLPDSLLPEALGAAKASQDNFLRLKALRIIFPRLSADLLPEAIDAVRTTEERGTRLDILRELIELVSEIPETYLPALLDIARTFQIPPEEISGKDFNELEESANCTASTLIYLSSKLTTPLLRKALEIAQEIPLRESRNYAFKAIAPYLPLSEALTVIQMIDNRGSDEASILKHYKIEILIKLVQRFAGKSPSESYTLWQASLHILAECSCDRKVLLTALEWLAPLIEDLGMQEGFAATLQGLQRVVAWYP